MSAAEIIAIIEKLPASEQRQVCDFLNQKFGAVQSSDLRTLDLAKAKAIGEGVFDRHPELFRRLAQ